MESSQTLRIFNGFFPYDYKALEQDINDHAAKGWRLVSVGRFFLTYKRADMTGLRAHIEVFCGAYETDNEKKLASYKKSREKNGWKFVGDLDFFYIWYAPEDAPFAPPTFEQEHNLMQKMVWSRELSALGIALVMGENVGTTITSNIVAMSANTQAQRAARAHLIFNLFGVIWVLCIYTHFVNFVCSLVGCDPEHVENPVILNVVLAAFHTAFNVCNVLILIWFIKPMEKIVCMLVPQKEGQDEVEEGRLKYIGGGLLSTAELSIFEACKEINLFAIRCQRMFSLVKELIETDNGDDFNKLFSRIEKYENITDSMEVEIANYLHKVSEGRLSSESKTQIQCMLRMISELESIGDSCYNLGRTINRLHMHSKERFSDEQTKHIHTMISLVSHALDAMVNVVEKAPEHQYADYNVSYNIEHEINNYRNQLKNQNLQDINDGLYSYQIGVYYMDFISECEKLGDYVVNVVQATK